MLDQTPKLPTAALQVATPYDRKQRRKMLLAVVILLAALAVILIKEAPVWFGSSDSSAAQDWDSDSGTSSGTASRPRKAPAPAPSKPVTRSTPAAPASQAAAPPAVVNRTALPPLEVEVVAGDSHKVVRPGNNSVKIELPQSDAASSLQASTRTPVSTTAEHVRMSADTTHVLQRPVQPSYPMLARQMKVQGAVVLQALIGVDGDIQDLRVLSGPTILASAAQEAVKQWRFKPYLQNGVPIETEAKITVNFTISTI